MTAALRRELASDGHANSRHSGVEPVALGVRLDLSSPFEANSRRIRERDCPDRRRWRTGCSPSLNAGVSVSRPDRGRSVADRLSPVASSARSGGLRRLPRH